MVGMRNSWFSGQLAYYVERAAKAGFVAIHCTNAKARVAPTGGIDAILGTNPMTFGFPADPQPIVIDIGTSAVTVAELMMRQKLGTPLDPNVGIDRDGNPSIDPAAVWAGAILPWGGHRGYGIALAVQLLGILAGGATVVRDVANSGFFFLVINLEMLMPLADFRDKASELVRHIVGSRPAAGVEKVRVHGMTSAQRREASYARGHFEIERLRTSGIVGNAGRKIQAAGTLEPQRGGTVAIETRPSGNSVLSGECYRDSRWPQP